MPTTQQEHWDVSYQQWFNDEHYEQIINFLNEKKIKKYLDLGANTGAVCQVLIEKIPSLEYCYLVEPQIDNFNFIENRFRLNNNICTYNYGIYYTDSETMPMYSGSDGNVGGYTNIQLEGFNHLYDMNVITLENLNIKDIDFIKIDVEGAEENIIENSSTLRDIKYIELEFHGHISGKSKTEEHLSLIKKYLPDHTIDYGLSCPPTHLFLVKK